LFPLRIPLDRLVIRDLFDDRREIRLQLRDARHHRIAMRREHLATRTDRRVTGRAQLRKRLHAGDRHTGRLEAHDELQPVEIGRRVQTVSGGVAADRAQQPCLFVIAQRVRGDAAQRGDLTDRECFGHDGTQVRGSSAL
jgi:hypothetical protein